MKIPYVDLSLSWKYEKKYLLPKIENVFKNGDLLAEKK